jgi:Uma2 family endonuclease
MRATERRVTYAEMLQWPDDGRQYELYDGEVIVIPTRRLRHQRVASHVMDVLRDHEERAGGVMVPAPFDIVLSQHDVVQPDVAYFRRERRHLLNDWDVAHAPPDLAVEVLSPSTQARDRGRKMELLARFGVPEYWIVDPAENRLEIYVLRDAMYDLIIAAYVGDVITSPTLAGLSFAAARVFAD